MQVTVSKANQALVLPAAPAVLNYWPDAAKLDETRIVLPHTMHTYTMLRHLGFRVPSPMLSYYPFPDKAFRVQKATCKLLTDNPRAYVLSDLGTGKTATVLWAWDYLYSHRLVGKLLVVTTKRNMRQTWVNQSFQWLPHRTSAVLHGPNKDYRLEKLDEDADIYIINHDGVGTIVDALSARTDIDVLALDELAVYRNNSDRSKAMRKFSKRFKFVWGLTGKPMPNAPTDVWGQCKIITPNSVPEYFKTCREQLMSMVTIHKWKPKPDAVNRAFDMMQPSVRFTLEDVTELPPVTYHPPLEVPLSPRQASTYAALAGQMKAMVEQKAITAFNAGAAMNKLLQVSCGWVYTSNPEYADLKPLARIDTLLELLDNAPEKTLVFVPYRHALEELSKILKTRGKDKGGPLKHYVVHGGTKDADADKMFFDFQNTDDVRHLLAHPKCCCHGLTLTQASTMVWYGPITSLDIYDQACGRIRRVGQSKKQQVYRMQSTPVERRVYKMLQDKQNLQEQFLTLLEEATEAGQ